jgi:hypothetical protein
MPVWVLAEISHFGIVSQGCNLSDTTLRFAEASATQGVGMLRTYGWLIIGAAAGFIVVLAIHLFSTDLPAWAAAALTTLSATISGSTGGRLGLEFRDRVKETAPVAKAH